MAAQASDKAAKKDNAASWVKWRRRVRVALIHQLPLRGTQKVLMRAICELLGEKEAATTSKAHPDAWAWPSLTWMANATGRQVRQVQNVKKQLIELGLLEEDQRFERGSGRQESNRIRIVWQAVGKLTDRRPMCTVKQPLRLSTSKAKRASQIAPPGAAHCTPPVQFVRTDCTPPVQPTAPLECHLTNERHLPSSNEAAPPQPDGEGKDVLFWQKAVEQPQLLRQAVKNFDAAWMQQAWSEAVAAGWQQDTRDGFRRFLAAAYYVINPPKGFLNIDSPPRVLRQKLIANDWKTGRTDEADDAWAKLMLRRIEQPEPDPRTSDLTETIAARADASKASQLAALQTLKKGT